MSMRAIGSALNRKGCLWWVLAGFIGLTGCRSAPSPPARTINIQQDWEIEPGDLIADYLVVGGLGDLSIQVNQSAIRAPFDGKVEPGQLQNCAIYSTPEVPAYLFRFCGLRRLRYGSIQAGATIGHSNYLQFATLRRQPDGTWTLVEPSTGILERALTKSGAAVSASADSS